MTATEADIAAQLIERLLADPAFRARFRRDPAAACREAGLDELADEMSLAAGRAMHTLDIRESRSSLAGVLMAAAMEGMGVYEFSRHVAPAFGAVPEAVNDVLSRLHLPAIPGGGALAGGHAPAAAVVDGGAAGPGAAEAAAGAPGAPAGAAAGATEAAAGAPAGAAAGAPAEAADAAAGSPGAAGASAVSPDAVAAAGGKVQVAAEPDPAAKAAARIAAEASPEARRQQAIDDALEQVRKEARDLPAGTDVPDGPVPLHAAVPAQDAHAPATPAGPAAAQPAAPAADAAAAQPAAPAADAAAAAAPSGGHVDPTQFGVEGTGGPPSPQALALLDNKNVVLDANGVADLKAGKLDPRLVAVLTKLSEQHKITVSCTASDHPKFTTGGSVSNHFLGRGADIAAIDGVPVNASNFDAREIATQLAELDPSIRPNEIGSPFAIAGPGFFTDADHQDHIHVGFKQAVDPGFQAPGAPAAATSAPAGAAAAVPGAPAAAPAAPAAEAVDPRRSGSFLAAAAHKPPEHTPHASAGFLKAVEPPGQHPAPASPDTPGAPNTPGAPAAAEVPAAAADLAAVSDTYPGDNATKAQLAAWMGKLAEARGLPRELPVMAALTESGLQNLSGGDRDSVGFFQMRVGIWNHGAYAGYPDNPELQVKWFLDQAEAVKKRRIANGQPIDDPNHYGDWIADVEQPAAQYRGRYAEHLTQAKALFTHTPADARLASADAAADAVAPPALATSAAPQALAALKEAEKYMGTPYKWGGSTPQTGFDCSGLVQWAYAKAGIRIPRVTDQQILATNGTAVRRSELLPGDLVFFRDATGYVHHVGMSLGGDKFIHAPHTGDVVKVSNLKEPYYAQQFTGGRRFAAASAGARAAMAAEPAAPAAPAAAVDPRAVAEAQAAVARDAAEARRHNSAVFLAIKAQEEHKEFDRRNSMMFLKAVDPKDVQPSAAAEPASAADAPAPAANAGAAAPAAADPATPAQPGAAAPPAADPAGPAPAAPSAGVAEVPAGHLASIAADYPGDRASRPQLAAWLARQAEKHGLPRELPVMASLVESGVQNLPGGDRDSVGFFQMRVGIWNQGAYAGYPDKPELQIKWFIDHALAIKRQRIAAGDADFGRDPSTWGEWIADVERPAAEFRHRYQERLEQARAMLARAGR